jgi:hypothetical protein
MSKLKITTKTEIISPKIAKEYLSKSNGNTARIKPIIKSKVDQYARSMASDQWYHTHQGLAFNTNGELVDGHNRLHAVVVSGKSVIFQVSYNVPVDALKGMDQGKIRNLSDITRIPKGVVECARFAARLALDNFIPTPFEVEKMYRSPWGSVLIDLIVKVPKKTRYFGAAPMKVAASFWGLLDGGSYSYSQYEALVNQDYDKMSEISKFLSKKVAIGALTTTNHDQAFAIGMQVFNKSYEHKKRFGKINIPEQVVIFRDEMNKKGCII